MPTAPDFRRLDRSRRSRAVAPLAWLLVLAASSAGAVDITVTTTDDELTTDGDCSLRGAVRAANLNSAQDACPAGSATERDRIVLADGATYSLVIAGGDSAAADGDLDVQNNASAAEDLLIEVAGGGRATISQDAVPDDRVFDVFVNANVTMRGVTIRGGSTPNNNGGGIQTGSGASLTLEDCGFVGNDADNLGGAIMIGGTLSVTRCVFTGNRAASSGGAIFVPSGTSATVADSLFDDNRAVTSSGGAIRNTGSLTVSGSTFVANRAPGTGGAIVNSATAPGALVVGTSCFVGNEDVAVDNFVPALQTATGSWWGAADGPSGGGPGSGDSVDNDGGIDADGFATSPLAACRPLELVANTHFEIDRDANGAPDRWRLRRLDQVDDGAQCESGACVLQISGDGQRNQVLQTIDASGAAGDGITFSARSAATDVPASVGKYLVELSVIHADGSKQRKTVKFSPGTHGFEERSKTIVASEDWVRLKVRIEYGRASGVVQLDDVSVVLE